MTHLRSLLLIWLCLGTAANAFVSPQAFPRLWRINSNAATAYMYTQSSSNVDETNSIDSSIANGDQNTTTTTTTSNDIIFTGRGLLRGIDPRQTDFYSGNLSMATTDLELLYQPGLFWEAAELDAQELHPELSTDEYVDSLKENFLDFINSDIVHDREELASLLKALITTRGNFGVLLGGKSVGKSLVLQNVTRQYSSEKKHLVLYVDGRDYCHSLDKGLFCELNKIYAKHAMREKDWVRIENLVRHKGRAHKKLLRAKMEEAIFDEESMKLIERSYEIMYSNEATRAEKEMTFLRDFCLFAESQNRLPCLILDEASEILGQGLDTTKEFLTQLVAFTKQDKTLNVILTSTNHDYPYQLEREGFNLRDLTEVVVACELSPRATWDLLLRARYESSGNSVYMYSQMQPGDGRPGELMVGMGPRLAGLFLSAYGGHLFFMKQAIVELARAKKSFAANTRMPGRSLKSNIQSCLKYRGSLALLTSIAKHGYAPIRDPKLPLVKKIARLNIADVVDENMVVIGVPNDLLRGSPYGLVASSQSVRLVIAHVLSQQPWWRKFAGRTILC